MTSRAALKHRVMHVHLHPSHESSASGSQLARLASYASVGVALVLLAAKIIAWWSTESLSMLSSLTDSLFDAVTSTVNLLALRYALKPADDDHRFGHTSIEDIAGLAQFAFISASMLLIILQSTERLFEPHPLTHEMLGIYVSLGAMAVTSILVVFQSYAARKSRSLIIAADRLHYAGDVFFNGGVLIALFLSLQYGIVWADPAMAIGIALVILWSARGIGVRAFNNLMDREMPAAEKEKILALVTATPQILGCHNMKTRYSGAKVFIQMHVDMPASLGFEEAHTIVDRLEAEIRSLFPDAEVIIHPDPVSN